jgi:hypothetical protein
LIKIQCLPEPFYFEKKIRQRGFRYLSRVPKPTAKEFNKHSYWRDAHDDLYGLYNGICAYCASWTPRIRGSGSDYTSVDHFIPKTVSPRFAYEWNNLRLCRARLNANKSDSSCVLDPMRIEDGWFTIDFSTFLIKPNKTASSVVQADVQASIDCLCLNDNDYVQERLSIIKEYACGQITLIHVQSKYPFIAQEFQRQDFDKIYKERIKKFYLP